MDAAGLLSMIAQLGMSLTGFAGLLIAFRFRAEKWQRVEIYAVRLLFISSASACGFALLPLPFLDADSGHGQLWNLWLAALGCWILALSTYYLWARFAGALRPRYPRIYWSLVSSALAVGAVLVLAAADVVTMDKPRLYTIGLYWVLAVATLQLMMQVMASLRSADSE